MMKMFWVLAVVVFAITSAASAGIIFSDDFEYATATDLLGKWNTNFDTWVGPENGTTPMTVVDGQLLMRGYANSANQWPYMWHTSVAAKANFSNPGTYTVTWQQSYAIQNDWQRGIVQTTLPGGVVIAFSDWGNPVSLSFQGATIEAFPPSTLVNIGAYNTLTSYKAIIDGSVAGSTTISLFKDDMGTPVYTRTMAADANFANYGSLGFYTNYGVAAPTLIDNVQVDFAVPEPMTIGLLAIGGLMLRRRK